MSISMEERTWSMLWIGEGVNASRARGISLTGELREDRRSVRCWDEARNKGAQSTGCLASSFL